MSFAIAFQLRGLFINMSNRASDRVLRRRLLGTASAVAMLGIAYAPQAALADDASGTHLWLDLTGQYSFQSGQKTQYADPFGNPEFVKLKSSGGDGTIGITLQKDEWFFNLNFNYGRTGKSHAGFQHTNYYYANYGYGAKYYQAIRQGAVSHREDHKMLDFTVGQDVGLGMLGMEGSSIL